MITVSITYLVIGGVILLYLLFKTFEYKSKLNKPEVVYVDTSGITSNPPQFIEVLQNKTINFTIGVHSIKIAHISISKGLSTVNKIANLFQRISDEIEKVPKNKIEQFKLNVVRDTIYKQIVNQIYILSEPFAKNKKQYKKELYKISKINHEKIFLIVEQIFDYWMYIKKLLALLAKGGSHRMIIGEGFTWNSCNMDMTGNLIIKPRFVSSTN